MIMTTVTTMIMMTILAAHCFLEHILTPFLVRFKIVLFPYSYIVWQLNNMVTMLIFKDEANTPMVH